MKWPFHHKHKAKKNIAAVPQTIQGLQLSSSAVGLAIPLVYGQARVASKLIHYKKLLVGSGDFRNLAAGTEDPDQFAIAMAICEGPITGIVQAWDDKDNANAATLTVLGFLTFLGTLSQAAWAFLTSTYPGEAVPYELTAYVAHPKWPAPGGSLPNYSWEVQALLQWGSGIVDSNPKDIVTDFLTDPNRGALFPASLIASLVAFRDYCTASGTFLSPVYDTQAPAAQHLQELIAVANSALVWSDGLLKIIPYADQAITGNSVTYTPNTTPLYNLTDDDFIAAPGDDPVLVTRRPQSDVYNQIRVEFDNRSYQYNGDITEAKDQNSIELYGLKPAPVIKAPFIKDPVVARLVAQLALQRQVYIRNTYAFKLPFRYVLLEPMDLVTLTDSNLGLNQTTVRLTEVVEEDDETFSCTAEEWPFGVATAASYGSSSTGGIPTLTAFEKLPKMPEISGSCDNVGQLLLNLSGDARVAKHIYVVRTDRLPTLAETRAGTTINFAGQSGIATGASVLPGASFYVGDLAYNASGGESPLALAIFKREGVDVDAFGRLKQPKGDIENMVANGGGELGALALQAPNWTNLVGNLLVPDTFAAKFGDRSLAINNPSAADSANGQVMSVLDAAVYELSGWIKVIGISGTGQGAILNIDAVSGVTGFTIFEKVGYDPAPTEPDVGVSTGVTTQDWTFVRCLFRVIGTGTLRLSAHLGYSGTLVGEAWFDGVKLRRVIQSSNEGGWRSFQSHDSTGHLLRGRPLSDGKYALRATDASGATTVSDAFNGQGSIAPASSPQLTFTYNTGGPATGKMWIAFTWPSFTLYRADLTTVSIPASSSLATPPSPTLSQIAGGPAGPRTLFVKIGYTKNNVIYRVGPESVGFTVLNGNQLKVTSPAAVTGYDGWVAMVGTSSGGEFIQVSTVFGSDYTEGISGFNSTTTTSYNSAMDNAATMQALNVSPQHYFEYPYFDVALGFVAFTDRGSTAKNEISAAAQNADGRVPVSVGGLDVPMPTAGNTGSGSLGGGRFF